MKTVFVDMDGVLTNFEKRYTEVVGIPPNEVGRHREHKEFSKYWRMFIEAKGFEQLEWFPGGERLVEALRGLRARKCILSSSGGMTHHSNVMGQKINWLQGHGLGDWPVVIVPGRRYKAGFASSSCAMIDDTKDVIESFGARGGYGILHVLNGEEDTIQRIQQWDAK